MEFLNDFLEQEAPNMKAFLRAISVSRCFFYFHKYFHSPFKQNLRVNLGLFSHKNITLNVQFSIFFKIQLICRFPTLLIIII